VIAAAVTQKADSGSSRSTGGLSPPLRLPRPFPMTDLEYNQKPKANLDKARTKTSDRSSRERSMRGALGFEIRNEASARSGRMESERSGALAGEADGCSKRVIFWRVRAAGCRQREAKDVAAEGGRTPLKATFD